MLVGDIYGGMDYAKVWLVKVYVTFPDQYDNTITLNVLNGDQHYLRAIRFANIYFSFIDNRLVFHLLQ